MKSLNLVSRNNTMPGEARTDLNLNWEVVEQPFFTKIGRVNHEIPGHKVLLRSDNNEVLNVCKNTYTVFPNSDFTALVQNVLENAGGAYELADFGEWQGGRSVLAQLKQVEKFDLCGWESDNNLIIGNGHDGNRALFVGFSNRLLRCSNAFGSIVTKLSIRHSSGIGLRAQEFARIVKLYKQKSEHMKRVLEQGYDVKIDKKLIEMCMGVVLETHRAKDPENLSTKRQNAVDALQASIDREIAELGTNLFGLFNGITHYTTHAYKGAYRENSELLGTEARMNKRGFDFIEASLANNARTLVTV